MINEKSAKLSFNMIKIDNYYEITEKFREIDYIDLLRNNTNASNGSKGSNGRDCFCNINNSGTIKLRRTATDA